MTHGYFLNSVLKKLAPATRSWPVSASPPDEALPWKTASLVYGLYIVMLKYVLKCCSKGTAKRSLHTSGIRNASETLVQRQ